MSSFSRSGVTHVLETAAFLELFLPNQGEENFEFAPLNVVVSAGEQQFIEDSDASFRLKFRRVLVSLKLTDCSIAREGRYTKTLSEDEVALFREKLKNHKSLSEDELSGVTDIALAHKLLKIGLTGRFLRQRSSSDEMKDSLTQKIAVKIVGKLGGPNWEIGHEVLGDPRHFDALLRGDYMNDEREEDIDAAPLCYLEPDEGSKEYSADVVLSVNKRDPVYFPLGQTRDLQDWRERNKIAIEGTLVRKMLDEFCEHKGLKSKPGEIVLAHAKFSAKGDSG